MTVINRLWPSDTIWWYRSGSTLARVIACCLMAPSHYLNQCWLIIHEAHWHLSEGNLTEKIPDVTHYEVKITHLKIILHPPGVCEFIPICWRSLITVKSWYNMAPYNTVVWCSPAVSRLDDRAHLQWSLDITWLHITQWCDAAHQWQG